MQIGGDLFRTGAGRDLFSTESLGTLSYREGAGVQIPPREIPCERHHASTYPAIAGHLTDTKIVHQWPFSAIPATYPDIAGHFPAILLC